MMAFYLILATLMLVLFTASDGQFSGSKCLLQRLTCINAGTCKNGGTCVVAHLLKCTMKCKCLDGFPLPNCALPDNTTTPSMRPTSISNATNVSEGTTPTVSNVTVKPTENVCGFAKTKCYHGSCGGPLMTSCVCERGWTGPNCDKRCIIDCGNHTCKLINETIHKCMCPSLNSTHKLEGQRCEEVVIIPVVPTPPTLNHTICNFGGTGVRCYNGNCTGNSFFQKCYCYNGWIGDNCRTECDADCGTFLCFVVNGTALCNCPWLNDTHKLTGRGCKQAVWRIATPPPVTETVIVKEPATYWMPVGIVIGVLVVVIVVVVVALTIMWKKRAIFVLKLVYKFKAYVDSDEKEYDAFVSYKSSSAEMESSREEYFVIHELLPKLEREFGFRICVHFRDFVPGMSISDNVLKAIENSHRTIMLISQSYVSQSVWSRFEYEQAQVAVIQQKQRIIPIMYDDIKSVKITDTTLKLILASTTYLERPQDPNDVKKNDEFWTRLRLSMPKKRGTGTTISMTNVTSNNDGTQRGITAPVYVHDITCVDKKEQNGGHRVEKDPENGEFMTRKLNKKNKNVPVVQPTDRYIKYLDV